MPWTRTGDNAATHPRLLAVDGDPKAEDCSLNEVAGFVFRCYFQSAGHLTDYQLEYSTAKMLGNGRHEELLALATRAGLLALVRGAGRGRVWRLLDDPEFVHLVTREEAEWNRQRDRDRKNVDLTTPVRRRDGDACRYCGIVVNFRARSGDRSGTYDHLDPGQQATVATYVVCCRRCNSTRKTDPTALTLRPAPAVPIYSATTLEMVRAMFPPEEIPTHLQLSATDTAASATPDRGSRTARPSATSAAAAGGSLTKRQEPTVESGALETGTGRDGQGRDGTGRSGTAGDGRPAPAGRSRRGRRGRRGGGLG